MQLLDGRFIYSAIDNNFLEYGHLVAVERLVATAALKREKRNCILILIAAKGIAHEKKLPCGASRETWGRCRENDAGTVARGASRRGSVDFKRNELRRCCNLPRHVF